MAKYLEIYNAGEIEVNSFKLIGASTKRDDDNKIGFFGSGLKYAMSFLLREKIKFRIFSGTSEILITTKKVMHRDKEFELIQIDGEDTSMTTDMGPTWNRWPAIREIFCNAIDEGGADIRMIDEADMKPEAGMTVFYIHMDKGMAEVLENWDTYFSKDRNDVVRMDKTGKIMWSKPNDTLLVYRRGILCYMESNQRSCFHYDFYWVSINESREIENMWSFKTSLIRYFERDAHVNVIRVLLEYLDKGIADFEHNLSWMYVSSPSAQWADAIGDRTVVNSDFAGWFKEEISRKRENFLLLPGGMVKFIQQYMPDVQVLGNNVGDVKYVDIVQTDKQKFLLKEVMRFFEEAGYSLVSDVHVVAFASSWILGNASTGKILVSEKAFESGKRKLAEIIYEENEHIKTGFNDETRAFQDHLIGQVISRMEEQHAFFL